MALSNSLEEKLKEIDLETLRDADKFKGKTISIEYIESEDNSYSYQDRRWMLYTLKYSNKFQELRKGIGEDKELQLEVFDNLSFFIEKALSSGYNAFHEAEKSTSPCSTINFALINGLMGSLYLWVGKFILENSLEFESRNSLDEMLNRVTGSQVNGNNDDLAKFVLRKAVEHYEESKKLGNVEKANFSQLGIAYSYLAKLSGDPREKFKDLVNTIINLELSRQNYNPKIENDYGIANAYQELGYFIRKLDLLIKGSDVKETERFVSKKLEEELRRLENTNDIYLVIKSSDVKEVRRFVSKKLQRDTDDVYSLLRELRSIEDKEDKRFDRKSVKNVAERLLRKAESEYEAIHDKKLKLGKEFIKKDYSFIGKCRVRLGRLVDDPEKIRIGIEDLEMAVELKDPSFQICNILGEAYFTLAHYTDFQKIDEKIRYFSRSLGWLTESEKKGNNKKEFFGLTAECYRHMLKLEFSSESPNANNVQAYIEGVIKYVEKAGAHI